MVKRQDLLSENQLPVDYVNMASPDEKSLYSITRTRDAAALTCCRGQKISGSSVKR